MGLNLNYTPNRLVDITTLTEDQWLSWRRKGIGGSDVAVALNSSPYRTARDLYYDKTGVVMSDDGPDKSITFQIGHLLEDVVAQIFAKKTGLTPLISCVLPWVRKAKTISTLMSNIAFFGSACNIRMGRSTR